MPEIKVRGYPKGGDEEIEIEADLDDVWEQISDKAYAAELAERASSEDVKHAITLYAPDELWELNEDSEPLFAEWGEWDRAELQKAIRLDDGRRALELLRRHSAA